MQANNECFQKNLAFGQIAELKIARWLRSRGNSILPVYDLEYETGKGPRLYGGATAASIVAPDLLVFGASKIFWCECKQKSAFTWHRKTSKWTTGIDKHHYEQYLKVAKETKLPVWLMFLHLSAIPRPKDLRLGSPPECPVGLFGGDISELANCINHTHWNWGHYGMVYWAREKLRLIADTSAFPLVGGDS